VTIDSITVSSAEARYFGGFIYATTSSTPVSSTLTLLNTNTFTTLWANHYDGGMMWINNNVMDISMSSNV